MLNVIILLWTLLASPCLANTPGCTDTWFGSGCRYKCRCTNGCLPCAGTSCSCSQDNCDVNGECQHGVTCQVGWFGPACQYADLAFNTTSVALPYGGQVPEITDGQITTCLQDSASFQSVSLTWTQPFIFTWLRVQVSDPALLYSFRVQFTSVTNQQTDCTNPRNATVSGTNLDIYCNLTSQVKGVTLSGDGVRSLCSVYVSGGRNVALRESPTQMSVFETAYATKAVDGNNNGSYSAGSCASTVPKQSTPYPWWSLLFYRPKLITRILLYNRDAQRLRGFVLTAVRSGSNVFTYTDKRKQPQDIYIVVPATSPTMVSNITIQAKTYEQPYGYTLTLCEVEIYGETACPQGLYGRDCERQCNCDGECFVSTGGCPNGCPDGYQGDSCNDICSDTFFGRNCREKCSSNCRGRTCDRFNGICDRCIVGKMGDICDQDCLHLTFGKDCSNSCSKNCSGDGACHTVTGACSHGCLPGFEGLTCDRPCSSKFFGPSCNEKCSSNCISETCDRFTGICDRCTVGKIGDFCVPETTPGDEPSIVGPVLGAVSAVVAVTIIVLIGVVFWRRRRQSKLRESPRATSSQNNRSDSSPYISSQNNRSDSSPYISIIADSVVTMSTRPVSDVEHHVVYDMPISANRTNGDYYNTVSVLNTTSTSSTDFTDYYDVISS